MKNQDFVLDADDRLHLTRLAPCQYQQVRFYLKATNISKVTNIMLVTCPSFHQLHSKFIANINGALKSHDVFSEPFEMLSIP